MQVVVEVYQTSFRRPEANREYRDVSRVLHRVSRRLISEAPKPTS